MKKAIKTLYKIGFIMNLVLTAVCLGLFIYGLTLNGTPSFLGIKGDKLVVITLILFITYGLGSLVSSAALKDLENKPSWKRPHAVTIVFSFLGPNPVTLVSAVMALIEYSKEEYGQSPIDVKNPLTLLNLNKREKFILKFSHFFAIIPGTLWKLIVKIGLFFKKVGLAIAGFFKNIYKMFKEGTYKTRLSYILMGYGNFSHKQIARGVLFALFEVVFILFMILVGAKYLGQIGSLGVVAKEVRPVDVVINGIVVGQDQETVYIDNSFKILLYGVLTIFFIAAFLVTWYMNIKQAYANDKIDEAKGKLATDKDDLHALVDKDFYKTLLTVPLLGILIFTVLPLFFMVLVAFTNYDNNHMPPENLFKWVGFDNFNLLFTWDTGGAVSFSATFGEILTWTLIWAFFATFTNYFIGMMVAMLINKKGIKLKKLWRTVLVFSIAIPQFISLLYVSKMFSEGGIINGFLQQNFHFKLPFWKDPTWARITVIIINIWIGIPYLMLITTGILMNIPADLYESSKIDGASPIQQYMKITLPYMLFVTGPYLLTSFTGNMNNFNVIYLLTGGAPTTSDLYGSAGRTDLLITWLFALTVNDHNYKLASVIGILVFIVVAGLSLIVYNLIPSTKNEEDYA